MPGPDPGASYTDPRLVDLYDLENAGRDDIDFYLRLADDLGARRIIDLGCGTGMLTRALAIGDRDVIGVDPAAAMLAYARRQDGAGLVRWIEGDSADLEAASADLVLMTGNVSQVFLEDASLDTTLRNIHAALRPGGYLAFESRNPVDQPWLRWNKDLTFARFDSPHGPMETWLEVETFATDVAHLLGYNHFLTTDDIIVAPESLRFRSAAQWTTALAGAGFAVERSFGDWEGGPLLATSPTMVFVACRGAKPSRTP